MPWHASGGALRAARTRARCPPSLRAIWGGLCANGAGRGAEGVGVGAEGRPAVDSEERHQAADGAELWMRAVSFVVVLLSGEAVGRCWPS
jgi:hypothetical protein